MKAIREAKDGKRLVSELFYALPSQKDYPDYYETIETPIDLKAIEGRILGQHYVTHTHNTHTPSTP